MSLTQFKKETIPALLASTTIDASKGILFGNTANMEPNTVNRTILIGLGGTGVRTVDYVKGQVTAKLKPTWNQYIAFLGIDTDWNEFNHAKFLSESEKEMITSSKVGARGVNPASRSIAQKRLVPDAQILQGADGPGAGRKRQYGSFKIHDQDPGVPGVDEKVVNHIRNLVADQLTPIPAGQPGSYEIYVIGSVCGGTCSGTFLEMPALIDRALHGRPVHTRAILYLPDTLAALDPAAASELYANGYASLKELDYFMGESMRSGYIDTWGFNNSASPEITLPRSGDPDPTFFALPYLVGSQSPGSREASQKAMETIAEQLVSLMGRMNSPDPNVFSIESHFDNAKHRVSERHYLDPVAASDEAAGENHDRPRHYAAIGFAEASAPEKTVRAYTLAKTCDAAGLKPISTAERANLISHGVKLLPFRGEEDLLPAMEGTAKAEEILAPVKSVLAMIHSGQFNFVADLNQPEVTWRKIRDNAFDGHDIESATNNIIANRTNSKTMDDLRGKIHKAYEDYQKNVIEYVKEEGPLAFCNLFTGKFIPNDEDFGTGIEKMLKNLSNGVLADGKLYKGWTPVLDANKELQDIRSNINAIQATLLNGTLRKQLQALWVEKYNKWAKSRIDEKRREYALGDTGIFTTDFLRPAQLLNDEIRTFGYILEGVTDIYSSFGNKMDDFTKFQDARDNLTEVNIAAVSDSSYKWIKQQADEMIAVVNGKNFRDNLVENFFANRAAWMDIPAHCIEANPTTGVVKLIHEDVPVAARSMFDEFAAKELPPMLNVSIQAMFDELESTGTDYESTATAIVNSLAAQSSLQFNGDVSASFVVAVYPASLQSAAGTGPAIAAAIKQAFELRFSGLALQVFSSDDADTIRCYQLAAPFEMYHLHDLGSWENEYEAKLKTTTPTDNSISCGVASYLHCMSPSAKGTMGQAFEEVLPWEDYPSVVLYTSDPRTPDPKTGLVCREGELRKKVDQVIAQARELGVLYCDQTAGGFLIRRVFCDQTITWDKFDIFGCQADPRTGLLQTGRDLAETIATQHNRTLAQITKPVVLNEGGIFSGASKTEAQAWKNAARVLRAHVPMYLEVLQTLEKFQTWGEDIRKYNEEILKRFRPAKMVWLMKSLVLRQREDQAWVLKTPSGTEKIIANLTPAMKSFLPPKDKRYLDNGMLAFYLFNKLEAVLPGDALDERYGAARKQYEEYLNDMAQDELTAGQQLAALVESERAAMLEKGMPDEATDKIREKFRNALKPIGLSDEELVRIQQFYFRASLADVLD